MSSSLAPLAFAALDGTLSGTHPSGTTGTHAVTFQVTAIGGSSTKEMMISVVPPADGPVDGPAKKGKSFALSHP